MASVRLLIDSFIIHLLLYTTAVSLPIGQIPILHQNFGHESVECTRVGVFTPNWFLRHTRPRYRQEIHGKALFYTKGASEYVKQLTCNSTDSDYVSLWQIWPEWLYDKRDVPENTLRCIHNNHEMRKTFFENMSEAYARMARKHATVLHLSTDYADPPQDGIWGRIELPALRDKTDILKMTKISEDGTQHTSWRITDKGATSMVDTAIEEVQRIFRSAKNTWNQASGIADDNGDSCPMWNFDEDGYLDGLY